MSDTYDHKPSKNRDNFKTVTLVREEIAEIARTHYPFRRYLESKGIVHKRDIHVESWTPENAMEGSICLLYLPREVLCL